MDTQDIVGYSFVQKYDSYSGQRLVCFSSPDKPEPLTQNANVVSHPCPITSVIDFGLGADRSLHMVNLATEHVSDNNTIDGYLENIGNMMQNEQIDYTDSTHKSQLTYRKKASEFLNQEIVPKIDPEEIINVPHIEESESPTCLSKWYDLTALEEQNQEINQWRSNSMCRQFDPLIQQNPSFSAPTLDEQSVALSVLAAETAERDFELEQTKSGSGKTYPTENIIRLSEDDAKKLLHEKTNVIQMLMERKLVLEKKMEYRSRKEGQLSQKTLKKGLELQQKQKQHLRAVKEYTRLRAILHQINHDIDSVMTTIENQQSKNQRLKPIITAMQSFETELVTKHQELAYKIEKKEQELLSLQEESLYEIDAVFHEYEERINSIEAKNSKIQFLIRRNELKVASLQDELEKRQAEKIQLYNLWDELMKGNAAE